MSNTPDPKALRAQAAVSPSKLAHLVFLTGQLHVMRDWYLRVLNAKVAFENENLCFVSYDDEHHRIGLIRMDGLHARPQVPTAGAHHCAFTYANLDELFGTYLRLQQAGIVPFWCINHGPTTSMYYRDPDGNRVELQVDNLTAEECDAFFASGAYDENPIGLIFEPEAWIERLARGESPKSVSRRDPLPAGANPFEMIRD
ncbi:VOC family protein [Variovorax sp. Sphag1AA]|uniref:VOC family protein n=1 Tax=Variovorax sp. Sphag1AA TaxID=2587027 RepID=UPI00161EB1ED|nr:VOC family protein [Variovorax sp. Sphag1AA]MBB3177996.1 catechol 2,3-dioxygenase-like lactoylglutathione lyase family enzyme [Variovorax sp. Sphag1AA]